MHTTLRYTKRYAPPHETIRLRTDDPRILSLADRLWAGCDPAQDGPSLGLPFDISVGHPPSSAHPEVDPDYWVLGAGSMCVTAGSALRVEVTFDPPGVTGSVASAMLERDPGRVARLAIEAPAAELMARRGHMVLHAGAVVGPGGAVVIRGAGGSGKSTLVAAAYRAGLDLLGDESILVARHDLEEITATVREITLLPDAVRLLGLEALVTPAEVRDPSKLRLDLFAASRPSARRARRVATVLLGDRHRTPATLAPLDAGAFVDAFRLGEIEQERWAGDPDAIAHGWARHRVHRLDGASDLEGAVALVAHLASTTGHA